MKEFFVYIVECSDGLYYTGVTSDLDKRISEHNAGIDNRAFTFRRRPVELLFYETYSDPYTAFRVEKQIKGWSRRKKKALIDQDWDRLIEYSKNYTQNRRSGIL